MNRPYAHWAWLAVASLGLGLSGCGKGAPKEDTKTDADAEASASDDSAPAAEAPPIAQAAPAPAAPAPPPAKKETSGTDELLALSGGDKSAAAPQAAAPPAAQAPSGPARGRPQAQEAPPAAAAAPPNNSGGRPQPPQSSGGSSGGMMGGGYANAGRGTAGYPQSSSGSSGMPSGMQRPGSPGGPNGSPGGPNGSPGGPGGGSAADAAEGDFKTPLKGAESFLSALKAKDVQKLADATAKHAEFESSTAHRVLMKSILDASVNQADLDDLARSFDGMKVEGLGTRKSSGMVNVVVSKTEKSTSKTSSGSNQSTSNYMNRTLYLRKEADGWKVQDYSGVRRDANSKAARAARGS
jgi:hypothetical protein